MTASWDSVRRGGTFYEKGHVHFKLTHEMIEYWHELRHGQEGNWSSRVVADQWRIQVTQGENCIT